METVLQDLRYALRMFRRSPGFTLVAVLTLALGIGVNTAIFSIVHNLVLKPLPVKDPGRLAVLYSHYPSGEQNYGNYSHADYLDFREATDVFDGLTEVSPVYTGLSIGGANQLVWGEVVSGDFFDVMGVRPAKGRAFLPDEGAPGGNPVVVLSWATWKRRFAGDPTLVGRTVTLNNRAYTVVGVAPQGFRGMYSVWFPAEFWAPTGAYAALAPSGGQLDRRGQTGFRIWGRLKSGTSLRQAQARVSVIAQRLARDFPGTNAGVEAALFYEKDARPEAGAATGMKLAAGAFTALVALVLLIACVNVANLLLARSAARRKEIALRVALGAGRGRVVRQLLTESLLLGLAGGGVGLVLAVWGTGLLAQLSVPTTIPLTLDAGADRVVMVYALLLSLVTGVVFGLVPALQASRPDLVSSLKGDVTARATWSRSRLQGALVVAQVTVSLVLLICAGLFQRSLGTAQQVRLGLEPRNLLLGSVDLGMAGYDTTGGTSFYQAVQRRVAELPGVVAVTLAAPVPLEFSSGGVVAFVDGYEPAGREPGAGAGEPVSGGIVSPGYFATMRTRLLDGREFAPGDSAAAPRVAIVNEAMARRYWPGRTPIGRFLRVGDPSGPPVTVVGVAETGKYRMVAEAPRPHLFLPLAQNFAPVVTIAARTSGDPLALTSAVRREVQGIDPALTFFDVKSMDQLVEGRALLPYRAGAGLVGAFGLLALALAMIGLYGVMSYAVSLRTREIGIRVALGAPRGLVLRLVVGDGLKLTFLGVALGLALSFVVTRVLRNLLLEVSATDPLTFGGVSLLLVAVAAVASFVPARRAARLDPMAALRSE
jgi:predicted permease